MRETPRYTKTNDVFGLPTLWVNALLGFILCLICVIVGVLLYETRAAEMKGASIEAANLSGAITLDLSRNIELYDLSIIGVIEGLANPAVMASPPPLRQLILFDRATTATDLGAILVLDTNGNVAIDSASVLPRSFNYADRDYFKIHRDRTDADLYISQPLISRSDGQMIIGLSRRINKPDGSFGGVVVGTLRLDYIHRLFSTVRLGPRSRLTLLRMQDAGATVIMREPYAKPDIGSVVKPDTLLRHLARADAGEYIAPSVIDGVERLIRFQRVGKLPLVQLVAISIDDIYADWWRKTIGVSIVLIVCCAIILALATALRLELGRRTKAEAALVRLASEDTLTGLANRRAFDHALDAEWRRGIRHRAPVSLLMIDADEFKLFNDAFGHPAGDAALAALGRCLKATIRRPGDVAARYGGEEFAVILPAVDAAAAVGRADALRQTVLDLSIPHPSSTLGWFSISVGVATIVPRLDESLNTLVEAADAALYRSKSQGRNRSTLYDWPIQAA